MAARVCEPIAASSEPGEIPRRASAICASNTSWTGRERSVVFSGVTTSDGDGFVVSGAGGGGGCTNGLSGGGSLTIGWLTIGRAGGLGGAAGWLLEIFSECF